MEKYFLKILQSNKNLDFSSLESLTKRLIGSNSLITFVNPYSFKMLSNNINILDNYDYIFFDGISLIILLHLMSSIKIPRVSFDMTSLAPYIFEYLNKTNRSIYLIGSKEVDILNATNKLQNKFKKLNIIGISSGFFDSNKAREDKIYEIKKLSPEIIIVGMGSPRQEYFLVDLNKAGWQGTGFTCGAFFEQTAKDINYYPYLINKFNIRWMYRLIKKPQLFRRYFIDYPIQIIKILRTGKH